MSKQNPFKEIYKQLQTDAPASVQTFATLDKQRLQALYLIGQQLNNILNPNRLFQEVIKKIVELMKAEHAVIILREGNDLKIRIAHNIDDQSEKNALNFSRSVVSRVMNDFKPLFSTNAINDSRFSQFQTIQDLEILSFICVPVMVDVEVIGTIYVDNRHLVNVFSEADVEFLQAFANLLGIAIRNSMAYHQVEELNQSLEGKVKERTAELRKTIEELKNTQELLIQSEKMASVGRLIAGFLHEFNNPVNFIYSNLSPLEQYSRELIDAVNELLAGLSEKEKNKIEEEHDLAYIKTDLFKLINGIQEGAKRTRKIVEDLRNFSGSGKWSFDQINWNENLINITNLFQERLKKPVRIKLDFEKPFFIEGNRAELNQSILNLLKNAADAGADCLHISTKQEGSELRCEIQDNGAGIPQKDLLNIFDPFYTTKKVGEGMGLGLSIVYSTITFHHGRIKVTSKKGKGTTFQIFLPLTKSIDQ